MENPNISYIQSMANGDISFEDKLITIIKQEYAEEKKEYFKNLSNKKYALVAANVHKLKHKISILGLEKGYGIAAVYENHLLEGDMSLQFEFESILDLLTNYLDTL